jgi:protein involved in temperature-dependent protein secretion
MNQPSPSATVDPGMMRQAKTWFAALQAGTVDRSQLAAKASSSLTDADLAQAKAMIGNLGTPASFAQQQAASQGGISYAIYLVTFKNGTKYDFFFAVDQQGKVEGFKLGRPQ